MVLSDNDLPSDLQLSLRTTCQLDTNQVWGLQDKVQPKFIFIWLELKELNMGGKSMCCQEVVLKHLEKKEISPESRHLTEHAGLE